MKKIIVLSGFLFSNCIFIWSQNTIKTSTPCDDEVLFKTPGRWIKKYDLWQNDGVRFNTSQQKEVTMRLDKIHAMMQSIYPQPMALDAVWHRTLGNGGFAEQVKIVRNSQGVLDFEAIKEKPVAEFSYVGGFFRHFCNPNNPNEIRSGYPGGTGTWIYIYANDLQQAATRTFHGDEEEPITINGYPIFQRYPLIKNLGDFELLGSSSGARIVIIHRNGMLPYIPVTRKQYLERCIPYFTKWYDKSIKFLKEAPLPFDDKDNRDMRDAQIEKNIKSKDATLKRYQDELEKTTNEGLFDAPAIVQFFCSPLLNDEEKIFLGEKEGLMLVTENPDYMRKDLPKYIPQFFVVNWTWDEWKPQADIAKLIEENFPFDKLQAMIDK